MIDTKLLKEKVLDLAIRGQLVPQDPNDEPASVLLERIRYQKQQLVKEGKLKEKDIKNDTIIFKGEDNLHYEKFSDGTVNCIEDEIPFNIPDNWSWTRFSSVTINRDSERKPISLKDRTKTSKIYDYYGASGSIDKVDDYLFNERLLLIGEDGANLVTRSKPIAFFAEGKYWVNNHAHCIDATDKRCLDFICLYINAINLEKYITGAAQPKMNQDNMNSILIPFPPVEEQMRISNYVNELSNIICAINYEKEELLSLIEGAKAKILELAIRGQLVPQDPNEEPASVLLERIRSEKAELIKQGKIKRDKKESIIFKGEDNSYYETIHENTTCINNEIPYEIPKSWEWVRLGFLAQYKKGPFGSSLTKAMFIPDSSSAIKVYEQKNAIQKDASLGDYYISEEKYESLKNFEVFPNDIIVSCAGTIGETFVLPCNIRKGIINQALMKISLYDLSIIDFYLMYFDFQLKKAANEQGYGVALKNIPPFDILKNYLVPLPPINEQRRIIDAVRNYFDLIEIVSDSI